ncbi:hypothetical protein B566_EDAN002098 [Ephemera danica]|nr:hypothetical protein B566_EDAN002098 [Ephemera danica]
MYQHRSRPKTYNHHIALTSYAGNACQHCRDTHKVVVAVSLQGSRDPLAAVDLLTGEPEAYSTEPKNVLSLLDDYSSYPAYIIEWEGDLPPQVPKQTVKQQKDFHCGAGIAKRFMNTYGGKEILLSQKRQVGEVAALPLEPGRFLLHLVTKEVYYGKPTLQDIEKSLWALKFFCHKNWVRKIAMPLIACGLDKQQWPAVQKLIDKIFGQSIIDVKIYTTKEKYNEWPLLGENQHTYDQHLSNRTVRKKRPKKRRNRDNMTFSSTLSPLSTSPDMDTISSDTTNASIVVTSTPILTHTMREHHSEIQSPTQDTTTATEEAASTGDADVVEMGTNCGDATVGEAPANTGDTHRRVPALAAPHGVESPPDCVSPEKCGVELVLLTSNTNSLLGSTFMKLRHWTHCRVFAVPVLIAEHQPRQINFHEASNADSTPRSAGCIMSMASGTKRYRIMLCFSEKQIFMQQFKPLFYQFLRNFIFIIFFGWNYGLTFSGFVFTHLLFQIRMPSHKAIIPFSPSSHSCPRIGFRPGSQIPGGTLCLAFLERVALGMLNFLDARLKVIFLVSTAQIAFSRSIALYFLFLAACFELVADIIFRP